MPVRDVSKLTENQAKVMDFFSPDAQFTKSDLISLTGFEGYKLTQSLRSLVTRGMLIESADPDDVTATVSYRLPVDAQEAEEAQDDSAAIGAMGAYFRPDLAPGTVTLDLTDPDDMVSIPMDDDAEPESLDDLMAEAADDVDPLDTPVPDNDVPDAGGPDDLLGDGDMEVTAADLTPALAPPVEKVATLDQVVAILREVYASGHPDAFGQTVKLVRERHGMFRPSYLVNDAMGVLVREKLAEKDEPLPVVPPDDTTRAITDAYQCFLDLTEAGTPPAADALTYVTDCVNALDDFAATPRDAIKDRVAAFLADTTRPPLPDLTDVTAALDAAQRERAAKAESRAGNRSTVSATTRKGKSDYEPTTTAAYYVKHGTIKGKVQYGAMWVTSATYVRRNVTASTGFHYQPQMLASSLDKVRQMMTQHYPNAVFAGTTEGEAAFVATAPAAPPSPEAIADEAAIAARAEELVPELKAEIAAIVAAKENGDDEATTPEPDAAVS